MKNIVFLITALWMFSSMAYGSGKVILKCSESCPSEMLLAKDIYQVVDNSHLQPTINWRLSRISTPKLDALANENKEGLLQFLEDQRLKFPEDTELRHVILNLENQVKQWRVAGNLKVNLSPDYVRLHESHNKTLDGEYVVYANQSAERNITLISAASNPKTMPFIPGKQTIDYLSGLDTPTGRVGVVSPQGSIEIVPVELWNRRYHEPQPGSKIWIELNSDSLLGHSNRIKLNKMMIELLALKVS